ncbi:hypothetical protein FB45DRAFT_812323 [Roridomyces roridus]|uniref:F-box domain-containing protein n=1 Tax=Roridomyces roridus TaxID=1738132 RepID=A0AAD7F8P4_9AGAR|nr:hypothetical protein FB45DRAFT_812323 [Roridomyces roridus]
MSTAAAARSRIAQLDFEIADLQRSIDTRFAEREKCEDVLNSCKYPVLTLPVEITTYIFTKFLPGHPERPLLFGPESPSLLLQVCRQWRYVALATPELWSTMKLTLDDRGSSASQCLALDSWLQRSGNYPLSIELAFLLFTGITLVDAESMQTILRHASRWREMELCLPFNHLEQMTVAMPLLRSLTLGPTQLLPPYPRPPAPPTTICMEAPNLREVNLSRFFNPLWIALPWAQITTIAGADLYVNEAIEILRHTVALECCRFTIVGYADFDPSTIPTTIPLPSLRSLTMVWDGYGLDQVENVENLYLFFKALSLPALESIHVSEYFLGQEPVATLSALWQDGDPAEIEIVDAQVSEDVYAAAFPRAKLSVESMSSDEDESWDESRDEDEDESY